MTASLLLSPWLCPLPPPLTRHLLNSASAADICAAAADGDLDAVRALLAGGVDPNAFRDDEGRTALFAAISEGHEGVALELLRHPGIDVSLGRSSSATEGGDEAGGRDVSPLCAAAHEGLSAVIEALLVHGRDSGDPVYGMMARSSKQIHFPQYRVRTQCPFCCCCATPPMLLS